MPLGNLSKPQIDRGIAVLEEIKEALNRASSVLEELSSKFYTTIPHDFQRPTPIDTMEILEKKTLLTHALAVLPKKIPLTGEYISTPECLWLFVSVVSVWPLCCPLQMLAEVARAREGEGPGGDGGD